MKPERKDPAGTSPSAALGRKRISIVRLQLIREGSLPYSRKPVRNSSDAARILQSYLAGADREYFVVLLLDAKHRVEALNVAAIGSLTASIVHPREVFKPAVIMSAASIVLGHNHPSGDPSPSRQDMVLTQRLVQAGDLLGIKVLDHIIIGDGAYISFADRGLISTNQEGG
jgi:DNA repair protein RadC